MLMASVFWKIRISRTPAIKFVSETAESVSLSNEVHCVIFSFFILKWLEVIFRYYVFAPQIISFCRWKRALDLFKILRMIQNSF